MPTAKEILSSLPGIQDRFADSNTYDPTRNLGRFNPADYPYVEEPTPYDNVDTLNLLNANKQSMTDRITRSAKQFGANFVSGFGQGLANLLDVTAWGNDDYTSSLFGLDTKEMAQWSMDVASRNRIYEQNPGEFNMFDPGWLFNQAASAGTGVGMGAFSLLETVGIEAATFGAGTPVALARLGKLVDSITKIRGVAGFAEAANIARGMRSSAMLYGALSRLNEGRMEASQSYSEIYDELNSMKNEDGTPKYSEDQMKEMASQGADVTWRWNMALLPLDILAYRAMTFNPVSGKGVGFVERGLEKAAGVFGPSKLGRVVGTGLTKAAGVIPEGLEEGLQFVGQQEGKHYAEVLGGIDDGSSFITRFGKDIKQDEFWNNFAGGVIGAPIIGGLMNVAHKVMGGRASVTMNDVHADHIKNIGKMDNATANEIRNAVAEGDIEKASVLRRTFSNNKALSSLHLDGQTDKTTAFDSYKTFLDGTLQELASGRTEGLTDLGIVIDPSDTESIERIKTEFTQFSADADSMKAIYDQAKNYYKPHILPSVVRAKFNIDKYTSETAQATSDVLTQLNSINEYKQLSDNGKKLFEIKSEIPSLEENIFQLRQLESLTKDPLEKETFSKTINQLRQQVVDYGKQLTALNNNEEYTEAQRNLDNELTDSILMLDSYNKAVERKNAAGAALSLARRQAALLNNPQYVKGLTARAVKKAPVSKAKKMAQEEPELQEEVKEREIKAQSDEAVAQAQTVVTPTDTGNNRFDEFDNDDLFGDNGLADSFNVVSNISASKPDDADDVVPDEEDFKSTGTAGNLAPKVLGALDTNQLGKLAAAVDVGMNNLPSDKQSFKDLLELFAKTRGKSDADKSFNGLVRGWEASGRQAENYDAIYNNFFRSAEEAFKDISDIVDTTGVESQEALQDNIVESTGVPSGYDHNNQALHEPASTQDESSKSLPIASTLAFTNRLGKWVVSKADDGSTKVVFIESDDNIIFGQYIDSTTLLDPDKFREGTELTAKIPSNYKDILVPVFDPATGEKVDAVPFKQWAADKVEGSEEWISKIPIIVYEKGKNNESDKGIAFIHDTGWYNIFNSFGDTPHISLQKQIETEKIRKNIYAAANRSAELVITYKTETTNKDLMIPNGANIPVSQANPQSVIAKFNGAEFVIGKQPMLTGAHFIDSNNLRSGKYYAIMRYGMKGDKKSYLVQSIEPQKISTNVETTNTLKNFASLLVGYKNPDNTQAFADIRKRTGFDVIGSSAAQGVTNFLKQYIMVTPTRAQNDTEVRNQIDNGNNRIPVGSKYVAVVASGRIVYGVKGGAKGEGGYAKVVMDNKTAKEFSEFIGTMQHNIGDDALSAASANPNNQTVKIKYDGKGFIVEPNGNYSEYIKTRVNTNIKAINIGTAEKPNYVTQVQPSVGIKLKADTIAPNVSIEATAQQVQANVIPEPVSTEKSVADQADDLLKDALDFMGGELPIEFASPEWSEDNMKSVAESIDTIPGLQHFEQTAIKNFIYQHMVEKVKAGEVTPDVLKADIRKIFNDIVKKVIEGGTNRVNGLRNLLTTSGSVLDEAKRNQLTTAIRGLELQNIKLQSVIDSYDTVYKISYDEIRKNQYVTDSVIQKEIEDDSEAEFQDESDIDTDTPTQSDFTTNSLRVNPDLKIVPELRLLFEGIRKRNPTNPNEFALTHFGLDEYVNSGEILRYLQLSLINTPASFAEIINRLEGMKDARTWIPDVINKLNAASQQNKNRFIRAVTNTGLKPKFSMFNFTNGRWNVTLYDSHLNGVENVIYKDWSNTFFIKSGIISYNGNSYVLNQEKKKSILDTFRSLKDLDVSDASIKKIDDALQSVGIELSQKTLEKLKNEGLRSNYRLMKWKQLFTEKAGLFRIIIDELDDYSIDDVNKAETLITKNTIFKALAKEESNFSTRFNSLNFRDNGKSFFGLITPKFISDQNIELTKAKSDIREFLKTVPFSSNSMILRLLDRSPKFREQHSIDYVGDTAIKEMGNTRFGDSSISKLSPLDHELAKLGGFWFNRQGVVEYVNDTGFPSNLYSNDLPIAMRIASMLVPTMSDKDIAMWNKTAVLNLLPHDLNNGEAPTDDVVKILYEQLVKPDLLRMLDSAGKTTGIAGYEKGKGMFTMIPIMNTIMYNDTLSLIDHIRNNGNSRGLTIDRIEGDTGIMKSINDNIKKIVINEKEQKLAEWMRLGIVTNDKAGNAILQNIPPDYLKKFTDKGASNNNIVAMAAMDYTINSLINNANLHMLYTGDPALYYKSKKTDPIDQIADLYDNMNKRLALLIAPATPYPDGVDEHYTQIFLRDKTSVPDKAFLQFLTKMEDGRGITDEEYEGLAGNIETVKKQVARKFPKAATFFKIEGTDAQEYTTWKEHLNILQRYGSLSDQTKDITQAEINEARKIFSSNVEREKLTPAQLEIISKVMQPIKPRYVGNYKQDNINRMIYIKTSSFPLIPQLTQGFEIDKLRQLLEKVEEKTKKNVRASYESGNKIGAPVTPLQVWNDDGTFRNDAIAEAISDTAPVLTLDRKGWGIQQDVPFKSDKNKDDKIRLGTQLMKLLFGDGMMDAKDFKFKGETFDGKALQERYNNLFGSLIDLKQQAFFKKLALDGNGNIINPYRTAKVLQKLLKDEATNRGYPLNDIASLGLDVDGNFNIPLWASNNVNRFESLLNSIVNNSLVRIKFPGYSYVAGSNEGFTSPVVKEEQDYISSEIIYTKHWNGSKLNMTHTVDGELKKAQVFLPSKFKNKEGKLIDMFERKGGEYIFIEEIDGGFRLKDGAVDDELLTLLSFRIPTSSVGSAATIEIAGFIPASSGDLIIVPAEFTKQKGMDFDVDKEYTYHYWHELGDDGKIRKINNLYKEDKLEDIMSDFESLRVDTMKEAKKVSSMNQELEMIQNEIDNYEGMSESLKAYGNTGNEIARLKGKADDLRGRLSGFRTADELQKIQKTILEELLILTSHKEKMLQNDLIELMQSVMENPSNEVQSKINKALSTEYGEDQAAKIEAIAPKNKKLFTGLSDMFQKEQFFSGTAGKTGTGAYSLDVVLHSLAQQTSRAGTPIVLKETIKEGEGFTVRDKVWSFGNISLYSALGEQYTVDGDRSLTEVNSEQQNLSVDNAKLKALGKVNINPVTMDVDKVFNLLGADKGNGDDTTINKLSYAFLSQPILRDYVEAMQNTKSIIAEFDPNKKKTVIDKLIAKYYPEGKTLVLDDKYWADVEPDMSLEKMISELSKANGTHDGRLQFAYLMRFMDMDVYGKAIRALQVNINTDSKGLGKSFYNVIEKRQDIIKMFGNVMFENAERLIGDYAHMSDLTDEEIDLKKRTGYIEMAGTPVMIKPETIGGKIAVTSLNIAYSLYKNFLPYDSNRFKEIYSELLPEIGGNSDNQIQNIEIKQDILKGIKKYLAVKNGNGVFGDFDNPVLYRHSLFMDKDGNTSLATYIRELMNTKGNPIVDKYIKTNALLSRFEFEINIDGKPSLIRYNNAVGEDFNEQELYNAFSHLLSYSYDLPQVGNKKYTTTQLAQELIAYSHLGNAIQEAIQFTKFIPLEYYNQVGYSDFMKKIHAHLVNDSDDQNMFMFNEHGPSSFSTQYIQHNPSRVKFKLPNNSNTLRELIGDTNPEYKGNIADLKTFSLKMEAEPLFITLYNKAVKGNNKQQLYVKYGAKYVRIPVLGTFGMDEYDPSIVVANTIVNDQLGFTLVEKTEKVDTNPVEESGNPDVTMNIATGNTKTVLETIAQNDKGMIGKVAGIVAPFVSNMPIELSADLSGDGIYYKDKNSIKIAEDLLQKYGSARYNQIILHEAIHGLTVKQIDKYLLESRPGKYDLTPDAPRYVSQLLQLYNIARATQTEQEINRVKAMQVAGQVLTADEYMTYGLTDIYEFMSLMGSNAAFQKKFGDMPFAQTGLTLWERFVELIKIVLENVGIPFDQNGVTANTLSNMFQLIAIENSEQQEPVNPYQGQVYDSDDLFDDDNITFGDNDPLPNLSPNMLTEKYIKGLLPKQRKCN